MAHKKNGFFELPFKLKESETDDGELTVEGYANKNIVDSVGDRMEPSGVLLDRFALNPMIFYNHDRNMAIGKAVDWKITDLGLWIKVKLSKSKNAMVQYVRDLIKEGILNSFSIGFDPQDGYMDKASESYVYTKYTLNEVSVVTLPCNIESTFAVAKQHDALMHAKDFDGARKLLLETLQKGSEGEGDNEDKPEDGENSDDGKEGSNEAFTACVESKVPKLIEEGKPQAEAVAIAMEECREKGICDIADLPAEMVAQFEAFAAKTAEELESAKNDGTDKNPEGTGGEGEPEKPPMTPTETNNTDETTLHDLMRTQVTLLGQMNSNIVVMLETMQKLVTNSVATEETDEPKGSETTTDESGSQGDEDSKELKEFSERIDAKLKSLGH
jgi:HK97 family phage prohead protease